MDANVNNIYNWCSMERILIEDYMLLHLSFQVHIVSKSQKEKI